MDGQNVLANLNTLLVQLALQTRELSQKKEEQEEQIQIFQARVHEKKAYIEETRKAIDKLEGDIVHLQNTAQRCKESGRSLKRAYGLLLQYEKSLEAELGERRESCSRDVRVHQERTEDYREVLQKHREQYCRHPLAERLVAVQAENEQTEQRIRACEDQIAAAARQLQEPREAAGSSAAADRASDACSTMHLDSERPLGPAKAEMEIQKIQKIQTDIQKPSPESSDLRNDHTGTVDEDVLVESRGNADLRNTEETVELGSQQVGESQQDVGVVVPSDAEQMPRPSEEEQSSEGDVCFYTPPARMKAAADTPTFSANATPNCSPGRCEGTEKSPAFVFSLSSSSTTPGFSRFDCGFDVGSPTGEEDTPFSFTSSYFSEKKPPESKFSGFPFDNVESRSEDEFQFSFTPKSPLKSPTNEEKGGSGDAFPFSFNFGKF
ncbi:uncharacterized protein LOC114796456 isoform X2 [Denticeps clupeoides]|uniref:uncharacterized protein LOC114796456 isoform X2 n=1 Tax=Denticeps clupeoides TaxID=299321 RepID=UPI0010A48181|nr:uncharacterized protein LOC114796456 isoform X2 [Denticeps clupeoides]